MLIKPPSDEVYKRLQNEYGSNWSLIGLNMFYVMESLEDHALRNLHSDKETLIIFMRDMGHVGTRIERLEACEEIQGEIARIIRHRILFNESKKLFMRDISGGTT